MEFSFGYVAPNYNPFSEIYVRGSCPEAGVGDTLIYLITISAFHQFSTPVSWKFAPRFVGRLIWVVRPVREELTNRKWIDGTVGEEKGFGFRGAECKSWPLLVS